jgi:acetyltransferase-like isoleucine patch superfamily enzyme
MAGTVVRNFISSRGILGPRLRSRSGENEKETAVLEDCWAGVSSIVMTSIPRRCVVGLGSVVTRSPEDFWVIAGNPAKAMK